ncbi:hypothetical protein [Pseudomonas sp. CG7]|jgi:hypothetical protein|uniref:hypothetical protein n=1 Tax=unclassified Pseudomonas TaxID=196821 RepID=UPI002033478F|nr:hypothetical protein [Pseudomonas sp. CG7]MCM2464460.1 hypothetical protein [Pseudomonas sp. CG7]
MKSLPVPMPSLINSRFHLALGVTTLLLSSGCMNTDKTPAETKALVTVIPGSWSEGKTESRTYPLSIGSNGLGFIQCPTNTVMIGRQHAGDENGSTKHLCASLVQNGKPVEVTPPAGDSFTGKIEVESANHRYECPHPTIMTGRGHYHDENGPTWYMCGIAKGGAFDDDELEPANRVWTGDIKESGSDYTCPTGQVMTGRGHRGDENGWTIYQCATLY